MYQLQYADSVTLYVNKAFDLLILKSCFMIGKYIVMTVN